MLSRIARPPMLVMLCGAVTLTFTGCVSSGAYEAMQREADRAKQELQETQELHAQEQKRAQALETRNRELKEQTDKWEANLKATITRLERVAEGWGEVRDDLIRLNLDQEIKDLKAKNPSAKAVITLEPEDGPARPSSVQATSRAGGEDRQAAFERVLKEFRTLLTE